ncbi:virulence-associated protein E [Ancylobacter novellus DSM 506]|uniref:Virulence-associated protein E n=1 Tax=Ancylobacter novellus (strain ATCC 8093 / DSM 506 / JCM 20403 / CCM 1077 / IAM 12100 / NBRC 12443 / NCIMB 10456) TaxID=639283 RepID=D6ZZC6_ANCN5|nr:toprim domain-containing protein [Ancylobacter novellus]ADH89262.1 virulence-associated protein E [Ancylobacter novellus DSM 506]
MNSLRNLARALGGNIAGHNTVACPGPGHSRHDRSLSVTFTGDDFVVNSFAGDDWRVCRDYVRASLGLTDEAPAPRPPSLIAATDPARTAFAMRIWEEAVPFRGTIGAAYLATRGLSYDGDAIRFHPACKFGQEDHSAMVAVMTDIITGEPCGVHRTALLPDGSGKAGPGRMMLGRANGAVVRLSADDSVTTGLAIAEGIETALAAPFRPVWACLSAGTMAAFPVLPGIEALTVFADNDASGTGERAANECGARWHAAGREVTIVAPASVGTDMADLAEAA